MSKLLQKIADLLTKKLKKIWPNFKNFSTSKLIFIVILAILLTTINYKTFAIRYTGLFNFSIEFIVQIALNIAILSLFSFHKLTLKLVTISLIFVSFVGFFILHEFSIIVDSRIIGNLIDNADSSSNISILSILYYLVIFLGILAIIFLVKIQSCRQDFKNLSLLTSLSALIIFCFIYHNNRINNNEINQSFFASYLPQNFILSTLEYFKQEQQIKNLAQKNKIEDLYEFKNELAKSDLNIVLIIGESARSDHFAINGYNRHTNPLLTKSTNLISFKDVTPCANLTRNAVTCMMSHKSRNQFTLPAQETGLLSIFKSLKYQTSWFSMQSVYGESNVIGQLAYEADNKKFKNSYRILSNMENSGILDEFLLPDLQKTLDSNTNNFIILHTNGSHFPSYRFVANSFNYFKPICTEKRHRNCSQESIINSYDNSILYADYIINEAIKSLSNKRAILFYISDHGSFLGEDGKFFHGNSADFENQAHKVPMLLWMSDKLLQIKEFEQKFANAKLKINKSLSHDNLFHSILDCSGIKSNIIDNNLSICQ